MYHTGELIKFSPFVFKNGNQPKPKYFMTRTCPLSYSVPCHTPVILYSCHTLHSVPDTPEGFLQLGGILGSAHKGFSWDDLREETFKGPKPR